MNNCLQPAPHSCIFSVNVGLHFIPAGAADGLGGLEFSDCAIGAIILQRMFGLTNCQHFLSSQLSAIWNLSGCDRNFQFQLPFSQVVWNPRAQWASLFALPLCFSFHLVSDNPKCLAFLEVIGFFYTNLN